MNKILIIVSLVAVVMLGGYFLVQSPSHPASPTDTAMEKKTDITTQPEKVMDKTPDATMTKAGMYSDYTKTAFDAAAGKKRVYFFHAKWCPTCKAANQEFSANLDKIPKDVVLFKTDYDTQTELKKKYGITYQHTFVYVDANGNELRKWNGGGIAELVANTQ